MREYMSFTGKVYSDATICRLLKKIEDTDRQTFLDAWNQINSDLKDVYVSYDSTNFNTRNDYDGYSEYGYAKDDEDLPQVNLAYVTAQKNGRPLYYELYPGRISDSSEVRYMMKAVNGYGYKNIGFIFDRGYYSEKFLNQMSKDGYFFIIMLKDNYKYVQETIGKHRLKLTEQASCYIRNHEVSGVTERVKVGNRTYYVHVYYDDSRASSEKKAYLNTVAGLEKELGKKLEEKKWTKEKLKKYEKEFRMKFDLNGILLSFSRKDKAIAEKLNGMGYFAILTSKKMEASDALDIYRDRDAIEKMFRALKSGMDFDHAGVQGLMSLESKVFLTFIAGIIRNEIFYGTKQLRLEDRKNYTVPAVMRIMDMMEATKNVRTGKYIRRYASTGKQKKILTAFKLKESFIDQLLAEWNG
jgi:transposase